MDQYIGKLLDNRYEILEIIGTGGMARVYKARCHRLNRLVAIKILRDDLAQDAEFRRRFHDESQAVAMLSHPNIVAVYDVSRSSDQEYIVMELIDGITLKQYMQKKGNILNWREALHFITQIVKALGHAHSRGIIHRDIKPHNVMVLRDGSVKVADFGIARVASGEHSTLTQEALGSVHYISPEQARGSHIDARSDLYSAGVVLYEMITGRLPFEGDTPVSVAIQHINSIPLSPRELNPSIPEALEAITMKAMAPNPDNRYLTADAMLADLEEFRKNPNINFDYDINEFAQQPPDESAMTQIRGNTPTHLRGADSERPRRHHEDEQQDGDQSRHGGSPWPIAAAVAVILVFVLALFFFVYKVFLSSIFAPSPEYMVPTLTGQIYEEVLTDQDLIQDFTVTLGDTINSEEPAGTIIRQNPEGGSKTKNETSEITVTVSSGPKIVKMIDVANQEYLKALETLKNMGLDVNPTYAFDDEVPNGYVISFTPLTETPLQPGDEVQLTVSKGKEEKKFPIGNFINMNQANAESSIRMMNLTVGSVDPIYSDTIAEGLVVNQYPTFGTEVAEGTVVNLQVSKGPDPNAAPTEVSKTISVTVPSWESSIAIRVVQEDGKVVYEQTVDPLMSSAVSFEVTGTGSTEYSVYFDNTFDHTIVVTFS